MNLTINSGVQTKLEGAVLVITLDRPKANAINVATSLALHAAFERLEHDPALRVGIITGTGRFFSAGWDLNAALEGEAITANHGPGGFAGLTEYFDRTKPVIAAVNGLAIGGGFELALAADLMVAASTAEFALPEARLGMMADSGGVLRLPQRLPRVIANDMLLSGRRMGAQEALQWGLLNAVVPPDALMAAALTLAQSLTHSAPLSVAALLELTRATGQKSIESGYQTLRSGSLPRYQSMLSSEDAQEGPRAFAEKRAPVWRGR